METAYFWRCTNAINGRRYTTRWRCTEAAARQTLIDPERIECGALAIEPVTCGHTMPSGLVRRADGAMMPPSMTAFRDDGAGKEQVPC